MNKNIVFEFRDYIFEINILKRIVEDNKIDIKITQWLAKLQNTRPLVIFHCVAIFSVATATQSRAIKLQYQENT